VPPARFPEAIEKLGAVARQHGATILTGLPENANGHWTNSVLAIGPDGKLQAQRYDKQHLVPFGEFIPFGFRWFVDTMKMPLGDFARGAADQQPFIVKGVKIAPNICYEDVFGDELRDDAQRADVLLNVSNLAWFGDSWAMPQHLQIARMRSIELGRPSLRATNTGVTAVIDAKGAVQAQLPLNTQGSLDATVRINKRDTLYTQIGDLPLLLFAALVLLQCWRTREQPPAPSRRVDAIDVEFREIKS
jgi:apolipoprotein N-acyltransferase